MTRDELIEAGALVRANLRAKAEALTAANGVWLYREDVLALFDEGNDD